jgi:HEPN domain-containing protein
MSLLAAVTEQTSAPFNLGIFETVIGMGILIGGAVFIVAQWRNGKYKALEMANTAILAELEAQKERGDRLEKELAKVTRELTEMRAENKTLRELVMGAAVPNAMTEAIAEIVGKGTATGLNQRIRWMLSRSEFWELLQLSRRRPKAVIFDLDSTIASDAHRAIRFLDRADPDWSAFHAHQVQDAPIKPMVRKLLREKRSGNKVIIVTLRPERFRAATEQWLRDNDIPFDELHLRPEKNYTPGAEQKERMLVDDILPKYEVVRAYDDNGENADMFRSHGIRTFQPRYLEGSSLPRAKGVGRYERSDPNLEPDSSIRPPTDPRHPGRFWVMPHDAISEKGNKYHVDGHWRQLSAQESGALERLRLYLSRVK